MYRNKRALMVLFIVDCYHSFEYSRYAYFEQNTFKYRIVIFRSRVILFQKSIAFIYKFLFHSKHEANNLHTTYGRKTLCRTFLIIVASIIPCVRTFKHTILL